MKETQKEGTLEETRIIKNGTKKKNFFLRNYNNFREIRNTISIKEEQGLKKKDETRLENVIQRTRKTPWKLKYIGRNKKYNKNRIKNRALK